MGTIKVIKNYLIIIILILYSAVKMKVIKKLQYIKSLKF